MKKAKYEQKVEISPTILIRLTSDGQCPLLEGCVRYCDGPEEEEWSLAKKWAAFPESEGREERRGWQQSANRGVRKQEMYLAHKELKFDRIRTSYSEIRLFRNIWIFFWSKVGPCFYVL